MKARKVELKEESPNFKYRDVISVILSRPLNPQMGMIMPEIRRCNKILDKLDGADGFLLLSEEEWVFLKERVDSFPFGVGGKQVGQFGDDVANAEVIELEAKA